MGGGFGGGMNMQAMGGVPPGQLFILRKTPCNEQIVIAVDMSRAYKDPRARPLVQPGDMIILQYRPIEEIFNFGIGTFFTYGIFQPAAEQQRLTAIVLSNPVRDRLPACQIVG